MTRQDLSSGYQTAQSCHAVAEFAYHWPEEFKDWRENGNYMICLAAKDSYELTDILLQCAGKNIDYQLFAEDDIDEITAVAIFPHEEASKITSHLPLANRVVGVIDKHNNTLRDSLSRAVE